MGPWDHGTMGPWTIGVQDYKRVDIPCVLARPVKSPSTPNWSSTLPPSTICHLPSAICHLPFAICHLPFAICHLPFAAPSSLPLTLIIFLT